MLKTFFKIAFLSALLSSLSLADDFLAKLTNGALSDNLAGVKMLTKEEASKVVGGYNPVFLPLRDTKFWSVSISEMAVLADLTDYEKEIRGICHFKTTKCSSTINGKEVANWSASERYKELVSIADPEKNQYLGFSVTQTFSKVNPYRPTINYAVTNLVLGVSNKGTIYKIQSSKVNYNGVAKELRSVYEKAVKNCLASKLLR